jgi:uncharacterized protein (TIGR00369 family)
VTATLSKEQIQQSLDNSSFVAFAGLKVIEADPVAQQVTMHAPMRPEFERRRGSGQWHGGPIAAVIDTAGDYALAMMVGRPLPTVNFSVDFLKPAVNSGITAVARVRRNGKSVGVVDIEVFDDAKNLVAIGRATYSTLAARPTSLAAT